MPDTLDWTAPELLSQGAARLSPGSDVYALAITWWEVLTLFAYQSPASALMAPINELQSTASEDGRSSSANVPGSTQEPSNTRDKIIAGWRPSFEGTSLPTQLQHTIVQAWGNDVSRRADASNLVLAVRAIKDSIVDEHGLESPTP